MSENNPIKEQPECRKCDPNDPEELEQKLGEMDELFRVRLSALCDEIRCGGASDDENNRESLVIRRRKLAIRNLFSEAQRRFADKYPSLSIPDELMKVNAPLANMTFRTLNKEYDIELAAAIWMLDYLKENGLFEEASPYFPTTREELNTVYFPLLSDSVHSDDELKSMIYLIHYRNRGRDGFDERTAFCDEADTGLMEDASDEAPRDRKNFDAVTALIDKKLLCRIQDALIEQIWAFFDSLLSLIAKQKSDQQSKKERLQREQEAQPDRAEAEQSEPSITLTVSGQDEMLQQFIKENGVPDPVEAAKKRQSLSALTEEVQKGDAALESIYFLLMLIPGWVNGTLPADCDMSPYHELTLPVTENPYDSCFAYLSLLDENRDEVWLYNLCYNVLALACHALPWADAMVVDPDGDMGELRIDYDYLRSLVEKNPDWHDDKAFDELYEMKIPSLLLKEKRTQTGIAKLTFLSSGLIPPRSGEAVSFTRALLAETDYAPETQRLIYNYIALAYAINHKNADFQTPDDNQVAEDLSQARTEAKDKDAEIKKLRAEIKHLKNLLNQTEHQKKDLSSELAESRRKLDASNNELAELRSLIREACETGESAPTTVEFPYTATKRTVIIGGHESWVKAIRPLLNNVRFISSSEQPHPGVIMNAEVVWIQSNAMGHSSFYKIIDIIRKHDIKVCYFKYASAEKCAEQLALDEIESEETEEKEE